MLTWRTRRQRAQRFLARVIKGRKESARYARFTEEPSSMSREQSLHIVASTAVPVLMQVCGQKRRASPTHMHKSSQCIRRGFNSRNARKLFGVACI